MSAHDGGLRLRSVVLSERESRCAVIIVPTLLGLCATVPNSYSSLKGMLLVLTVVGALWRIAERKALFAHWQSLLILSLTYFISLLGTLNGLVRMNPGTLAVSHFYLLWPLLCSFMVFAFPTPILLSRLQDILVWVTAFVSIYGLGFYFSEFGVFPRWIFEFIDVSQTAGMHNGALEVSFSFLPTLMFTCPFLMAKFWIMCSQDEALQRPRLHIMALISGTIFSLICGRRAVQAIVLLGVPATFLMHLMCSKPRESTRIRKLGFGFGKSTVILILSLLLLLMVNLDFEAIISQFIDGFMIGTKDGGAEARLGQLIALVKSAEESPLFGRGFGAVSEVIRNRASPWGYELFYVVLLFNVGIFGFIGYLLAIAWLFFSGVKICRSVPGAYTQIGPLLVGMSCFLVGTASNPYLGKFDYLWIIFLPLAYVNYYLLTAKTSTMSAKGDV